MKRVFGFSICLLGVLFVGCANESVVEGTVTYKGQPLEGATVLFQTEEGNPVGNGQTDASGRFKMKSTQGKEKIPAGKYVVSVIKSSMIEGPTSTDPTDLAKAGAEMMKKAGTGKKAAGPMMVGSGPGKALTKSLIPEKYGTPKSSGLTVTIPSKEPLEIKLVD